MRLFGESDRDRSIRLRYDNNGGEMLGYYLLKQILLFLI